MSGEVGSHPICGEIQQALLSCVYGNKDNLQDLTQKRMYHQIVSFRSNLNPIADENAVDVPPATMNSSPIIGSIFTATLKCTGQLQERIH